MFLQTWEANHVSQRLTEPEAERYKVAEFDMTLEGPTARWHANHLPNSFAMFEAVPSTDGVARTSRAILHHAIVAWLAQKRSVARTKDNVKVRKESPGFWTEERKE